MELIVAWWEVVRQLRVGFKRERTFWWSVIVLMGFCTREDCLGGVSSFVRCLGLNPKYYQRLLHFFQSDAVDLEKLTQVWVKVVFKVLAKFILRFNGRPVFLIDGITIPKEGVKMPGVQSLRQCSGSNAKGKYVMGHLFQCVGVLAGFLKGTVFSVPLFGRLHLGTKTTNRDKRTLFDKALAMLASYLDEKGFYLVGDAYYSVGKMVTGTISQGGHLIVRVKSNAVAYRPARNGRKKKKKKRGRKKKYGEKVKLSNMFNDRSKFEKKKSNIYGEKGVTILVRSELLLSKRLGGGLLQYVFIIHPTRGKMVLLCTDTTLEPMDVLHIYGCRFKIEVAFKQAVYSLGTSLYRFWMKIMDKTKRKEKTKFLHRKSGYYRKRYLKKHRAYEVYFQLALIAQGLLQYLSVTKNELVLKFFNSWFRTIRPDVLPSEKMVQISLRNCLPYFLAGWAFPPNLKKFIAKKTDFKGQEEISLTG